MFGARGLAVWGMGVWVLAVGLFLWAGAGWRDGLGRWLEGDKVKLEVMVRGCWWWVGLGVGLLSVGMFWGRRWWARGWSAVWPREEGAVPRWWIWAVVGLMGVGAAVRVPRMGLSLYNDEAHAFRAHLVGEVPRAQMGKPEKFRALSWWSTLYENRVGNNSLPFSLLARASYGGWRGLTGAPVGRVNEAALRLPVLLAGVGSIGVIALLGRRLGGAGAGLVVGCLAALHPWHLRYSVEARSYGLLMLMVPLVYVALEGALRTGRWRWWLGFGVAMGGAVAVWVGTAHLWMGLYVSLGAWAMGPGMRGRRGALLVPLAVAGLVGVACYAAVSLPLHLQLAKILRDPLFFKSANPFPAGWFADVAGYMGFGIPGLGVEGGETRQPTVAGLWAGPWRWAVVGGVGVWVVGLWRGAGGLVRGGGLGVGLVGSLGLGSLFTWGYCVVKGTVFLKWYALFLLPGLMVVLGVGLWDLRGRRGWRLGAVGLLLMGTWWPGMECYWGQGRENLRGMVELARGARYPESVGNPRGNIFAATWSESPVYDPAAVGVRDGAELRGLMAQARAEKRGLYVGFGHRGAGGREAGEVVALLEESGEFRMARVFPGLDEGQFTQYLYQLLP